MSREERDNQGNPIEAQLDDVTKPRRPRPTGGGGGPAKPNGYMETFDVIQGAHPVHAKPLPEDEDEEDKWP